jgi:hypothetical protein
MKTLFDRTEIHGMKARDISEEDKRDCLKLLHMVREKYGIDAYLYFRNMLAIVVMSQKLDYGGRWISLRRFINRNFDKIPCKIYFNDIKIVNYARLEDLPFFGIPCDNLNKSLYQVVNASIDYWTDNYRGID